MSPILELSSIKKTFGSFQALRGVDLALKSGEILGLVGPNGAGKSTLLKVATGQVSEDSGTVQIHGEAVDVARRRSEIAIVPQELTIAKGLTVEQNINLPSPPGRFGFTNKSVSKKSAEFALERLGINVNVSRAVDSLTPAEQRMVMIARAIRRARDILIVDEPTAALSNEDRERVLASLERLRDSGMAVIYVSHRFDEVERLCSRVAFLRDGFSAGEIEGSDVTVPNLVDFIAAGTVAVQEQLSKDRAQSHEVLLALNKISVGPLHDINIEIYRGEILALTGLVGAGTNFITELLMGRRSAERGQMRLQGEVYAPKSPKEAIKAKVSGLPQERAHAGFPHMPIRSNAAMSTLSQASKWGIQTTKREMTHVRAVLQRLMLEHRMNEPLAALSGGNRQKALLSRCLLVGPDLIVLEDPTVGVDVKARRSIHELLTELASKGTSIVFTSSDDLEIADLATRMMVVADGRVSKTLAGDLSLKTVSEAVATGHLSVPNQTPNRKRQV